MAAKHYQELEGVKVQVNDMDGFLPPQIAFYFLSVAVVVVSTHRIEDCILPCNSSAM